MILIQVYVDVKNLNCSFLNKKVIVFLRIKIHFQKLITEIDKSKFKNTVYIQTKYVSSTKISYDVIFVNLLALIFNLGNFLNISKNTKLFIFFKGRINHID